MDAPGGGGAFGYDDFQRAIAIQVREGGGGKHPVIVQAQGPARQVAAVQAESIQAGHDLHAAGGQHDFRLPIAIDVAYRGRVNRHRRERALPEQAVVAVGKELVVGGPEDVVCPIAIYIGEGDVAEVLEAEVGGRRFGEAGQLLEAALAEFQGFVACDRLDGDLVVFAHLGGQQLGGGRCGGQYQSEDG